ncbi:MAG: hypothetical protein ACXABY_01325 [Candidatus Thorarchaeota archaeon]|jgi:hypothetical protein
MMDKAAIPESFIRDYVDQLIAAAKGFGDTVMGNAAVQRADHIMDLVKAWREYTKRDALDWRGKCEQLQAKLVLHEQNWMAQRKYLRCEEGDENGAAAKLRNDLARAHGRRAALEVELADTEKKLADLRDWADKYDTSALVEVRKQLAERTQELVKCAAALTIEQDHAKATEKLAADTFRQIEIEMREAMAWCEKAEAVETKLSVLDGSSCAEQQAEGNGPCGACTICLRAEIKGMQKMVDAACKWRRNPRWQEARALSNAAEQYEAYLKK